MKKLFPKITLIFLTGTIFYSCSIVKKVPEDGQLLTKNIILANDTIVKNERIENLLSQKPNGKLLGFPLRLGLYNLAKDNPDSLYYDWLNRKPNRRENLAKLISNKQVDRLSQSFLVSGLSRFLKKTGEAPVIINKIKINSTKNKLKGYYENQGFFNTEISAKIDSVGVKKAKVTYNIITGEPSYIDSISRRIETPEIDSLFTNIQSSSFLKSGDKFNGNNFDLERARLTNYFRNNGVYHFQINHVRYDIITNERDKKVDVVYDIEDRKIKREDTLAKTPFKIYKINQVNIYTNNNSRETNKITDSVSYNNYNIYSNGKLNYKPKAITDAIFIEKGKLFSDLDRSLTSRSLSNLKVFNFPNIEYIEDTLSGGSNKLIANIYLSPLKKKNLNASIDFTHSNIQDFGITGNLSLTFRNLFRRAETLEITTRGNIGSSKDLANPNDTFFNISEYGVDAKLTFPRIFFPINTTRLIKKEMLPTTQMSFGLTNQKNIGLDKENFTGIINYNWLPKDNTTIRFDLINIQFVRNLNIDNYFNVYNSSYNRLNNLAQIYNTNPNNLDEYGDLTFPGAITFIDEVVNNQTALTSDQQDYQSIRSIGERRKRLIENNLIVSSAFTFSKNTRKGFLDNTFYAFKAKLETAGNAISLLAKRKNEPLNDNGNNTVFGIEYAQYVKGEFDLIKHWSLGKKNIIAFRTFGGLAVPYGNANSIPFSRSYFAGGSNDNRGWQAYSLGPGSSGGINDFNEANLKIAASVEYRFNIFGKVNGALFADAGNIWNIFDNVEDKSYTFNGIKSLQDIALGTGIGFRYDFDFFVFRIDLGYKTYNPAKEMSQRWFRDINFSRTVLNFGINYPF
ncbi:BamA/TamA family outer membrane protein [Flavobacterium sediminilitoris]|uniref:BamA/TamA family outer membrane protein n=1 Tax=Flavobacterium sediminilitoris TaxID=2024526 RepID=A0ABY4HRX8_9FLAO|nr:MULTISPECIES: BamA/TamA family outer membrane protein [Flavobacterium]UOX35455.1 BamA/TamA family outer membrane protein [Flavobacterium sediminilitoris]